MLNLVSISQSRCLSFQGWHRCASAMGLKRFQSRNRDAYHFRKSVLDVYKYINQVSISQSRCLSFQEEFGEEGQVPVGLVSISQSRCLSFQVGFLSDQRSGRMVSISQSRCLSFQGNSCAASRIRGSVSISQSRCLSFQAGFRRA